MSKYGGDYDKEALFDDIEYNANDMPIKRVIEVFYDYLIERLEREEDKE